MLQAVSPKKAAKPGELMMMQYNIGVAYCNTMQTCNALLSWCSLISSLDAENLFDTLNDPLKDDDDFTPEGRNKWTEPKLEAHMKQLAKVIQTA